MFGRPTNTLLNPYFFAKRQGHYPVLKKTLVSADIRIRIRRTVIRIRRNEARSRTVIRITA